MKSNWHHKFFVLVIVLFGWVVIEDLVNMHLKLIFKMDLQAQQPLLLKIKKSDRKDFVYDQDYGLHIGLASEISKNTKNILDYKIWFFAQIVEPKYQLEPGSNLQLRGPPVS